MRSYQVSVDVAAVPKLPTVHSIGMVIPVAAVEGHDHFCDAQVGKLEFRGGSDRDVQHVLTERALAGLRAWRRADRSGMGRLEGGQGGHVLERESA